MPKDNVVSFRLDDTKIKALKKVRETDKPVNVKSENHLCRKIVQDFLAGRLVYKNPNDRLADIESLNE